MSKNRVPMQVAPEFAEMIKNLQKELMMALGENISLSDLTAEIKRTTERDIIKNKIIERRQKAFDIPVKFHRR